MVERADKSEDGCIGLRGDDLTSLTIFVARRGQ